MLGVVRGWWSCFNKYSYKAEIHVELVMSELTPHMKFTLKHSRGKAGAIQDTRLAECKQGAAQRERGVGGRLALGQPISEGAACGPGAGSRGRPARGEQSSSSTPLCARPGH